MRSLHLRVPHAAYAELLAGRELPGRTVRRAKSLLARFERIVIFGQTTPTGMAFKDLAGESFLCFLNSATLVPDLRLAFDAMVLGVSPNHYADIQKALRSLSCQDFTLVKPFLAPRSVRPCATPALAALDGHMAGLGWFEAHGSGGAS